MRFDESSLLEECPVCLLRACSQMMPVCGHETPGDDTKNDLQRSYAHFEIEVKEDGLLHELGRGSMGVTYKAMDTYLNRPAALKVIAPRFVADESSRARFLREARSAASLRHPNIASIYYLGLAGSSCFYAMEFVEGETLERMLQQKGRLPTQEALQVAGQVASALAASHERKLVHRDLKPANLMVSRNTAGKIEAKVIDFGLVKSENPFGTDSMTSSASVFEGTICYASPEQLRNGHADIRSDIYSLGVIFWEMLVGKVPFDGGPGEIVTQHISSPLPLAKVRHFPKSVVSLLCNMLEKDPDRRPQSPAELIAILRAVASVGTVPDEKIVQENFGSKQVAQRVVNYYKRPFVLFIVAFSIAVSATLFILFFIPKSTLPVSKSIAVLPFAYIGNEPQQAYLSDGLTSEVIYQLSKVKDLRVISRNSILAYRSSLSDLHRDLAGIANDLGVATILESSVERVDRQIKVLTILYDARRAQPIWTASYEGEMKDLLTIQSDLAEKIALALNAALTIGERRSIEQKSTQNPVAYELYLRGSALFNLTREDTNEMAIDLFKQAIAEDSQFVLAYTALADAYVDRVTRYSKERRWLDSAIELCLQAIAIQPSEVRGYTQLLNAYYWNGQGGQHPDILEKALELAPNDEFVNLRASIDGLNRQRFEEAYTYGLKCCALNPKDPHMPYNLGTLCSMIGAPELAEMWMKRAIGLETNTQLKQLMEAEFLAMQKNYASALAKLDGLPLGLMTYGDNAGDLALDLCFRLRDWQGLQTRIDKELSEDADDTWVLLYSALALQHFGRESEAISTAKRAIQLREQNPPGVGAPEWKDWELARGYIILNEKEKAYKHLKIFLYSGEPSISPFQREQPWFDLFRNDAEFNEIMASLDNRFRIAAQRIRTIQATQ
jgi:serine/threonine protein kinase/tetratricopeptide (TPR) repeat protein